MFACKSLALVFFNHHFSLSFSLANCMIACHILAAHAIFAFYIFLFVAVASVRFYSLLPLLIIYFVFVSLTISAYIANELREAKKNENKLLIDFGVKHAHNGLYIFDVEKKYRVFNSLSLSLARSLICLFLLSSPSVAFVAIAAVSTCRFWRFNMRFCSHFFALVRLFVRMQR